MASPIELAAFTSRRAIDPTDDSLMADSLIKRRMANAGRDGPVPAAVNANLTIVGISAQAGTSIRRTVTRPSRLRREPNASRTVAVQEICQSDARLARMWFRAVGPPLPHLGLRRTAPHRLPTMKNLRSASHPAERRRNLDENLALSVQ
ncbi:hypothetical protein [Methylobacterium adhaesivum]|uniref:Uncharacterized protein n=1 Tax=Methylobacterium adhaesivum TaxID=333297 RepID=A0ABT8BGP3_9HYPH|nr:hypothetical protein [Methylobacterium adhaesivum]MDN3590705.1 hypothetical protein [Methylobacterium adhaesivum]